MLRSFRVANHRSIREAQELVLLPAYDKSRPVTPVAAIYGANASGKSNVLDALTWMRGAVLHSFAFWTPRHVPRVPFKLDPTASTEPSEFEVDLMLEGVRYLYGFVVDDRTVRREWLYTYPRNRRRIIFERVDDEWTFGSTVRGPLDSVRDLTRSSALFLSVAARSNVVECAPLFNWFIDGLTGARPNFPEGINFERTLAPGSRWRGAILALLKAADLGITDARMANVDLPDRTDESSNTPVDNLLPDTPADLSRIRDFLRAEEDGEEPYQQLVFDHGAFPVPLTVSEESAGTRTWLNLTLPIVTALAGPKVLLLDEADTGLHPHLVRYLVNLFRDPQTNPLGAQLIFTSHDATMLDEDTLSRDEIWFVEKDPTAQTTRLYSLAEFRPRKHENTERRYLAGSYGAVPVLSEFALRRALNRGTDPDAA